MQLPPRQNNQPQTINKADSVPGSKWGDWFLNIFSSQEVKQAINLYKLGCEQIINNQLDEAIDTFLKIKSFKPDFIEADFLLAVVYVMKDEPQNALPFLQNVYDNPHLLGKNIKKTVIRPGIVLELTPYTSVQLNIDQEGVILLTFEVLRKLNRLDLFKTTLDNIPLNEIKKSQPVFLIYIYTLYKLNDYHKIISLFPDRITCRTHIEAEIIAALGRAFEKIGDKNNARICYQLVLNSNIPLHPVLRSKVINYLNQL